MISKIMAVLLTTASFGCMANTNDELAKVAQNALAVKAQISKALIDEVSAGSAVLQNQSLISDVMRSAKRSLPDNQRPKRPGGPMLLVSFSMPNNLLLNMASEAARFDIPVVINGLKDNDFKATLLKFKSLYKESDEQHLSFKGVSIDPYLFQQFNIDTVPALLVTGGDNEGPKSRPSFDVVYGNASIKDALELIAQKGDFKALARNILEARHV